MYFLFLSTLAVCAMASNAPSMRTAQETSATQSKLYAQSLSPRPTSAPKFDLARRGLQARLLENVCGWNTDNIPRTCAANSYCAFIPDYWGCCGVDSDGIFYADCVIGTTCLDYAQYTASCAPNSCGVGIVWCEHSTAPYCKPELLQVLTDGILTTSTSWRCASVRTSEILQITSQQSISTSSTTTTTSSTPTSTPETTVAATTVIIISVENGNTYSSSVQLTSSIGINSPGSAAAGTGSAGGPAPSAQPAGLSAASSTASASSVKPSNTGAIAGGVVGGLILIALVAGLVFFLLKKKRSSGQPKADPSDANTSSRDLPGSSNSPSVQKEAYYPATNDKRADGSVSELHSPPQYYTQHSALSHSNMAELESSHPGSRTSSYMPGQQTRPHQEMSDVNYPNGNSKHFQIELPG